MRRVQTNEKGRGGLGSRCSRGFTLIELLVVIGLIGLLAAGLGAALGDGDGAKLTNAQQMVASLCAAARTQAVLHQTEARVFVWSDRTEPADSLRRLQVFRSATDDPRSWLAASATVTLPRGIYIVPPPAHDGRSAGGGQLRVTSALAGATGTSFEPGSAPADSPQVWFLEFRPEGTPTLNAGETIARILIAPGELRDGHVGFDARSSSRAVLVRANGAIASVDAPSAP